MDISVIEAAAKAAGIADSYISALGQPVQIAISTQEKFWRRWVIPRRKIICCRQSVCSGKANCSASCYRMR